MGRTNIRVTRLQSDTLLTSGESTLANSPFGLTPTIGSGIGLDPKPFGDDQSNNGVSAASATSIQLQSTLAGEYWSDPTKSESGLEAQPPRGLSSNPSHAWQPTEIQPNLPSTITVGGSASEWEQRTAVFFKLASTNIASRAEGRLESRPSAGAPLIESWFDTTLSTIGYSSVAPLDFASALLFAPAATVWEPDILSTAYWGGIVAGVVVSALASANDGGYVVVSGNPFDQLHQLKDLREGPWKPVNQIIRRINRKGNQFVYFINIMNAQHREHSVDAVGMIVSFQRQNKELKKALTLAQAGYYDNGNHSDELADLVDWEPRYPKWVHS